MWAEEAGREAGRGAGRIAAARPGPLSPPDCGDMRFVVGAVVSKLMPGEVAEREGEGGWTEGGGGLRRLAAPSPLVLPSSGTAPATWVTSEFRAGERSWESGRSRGEGKRAAAEEADESELGADLPSTTSDGISAPLRPDFHLVLPEEVRWGRVEAEREEGEASEPDAGAMPPLPPFAPPTTRSFVPFPTPFANIDMLMGLGGSSYRLQRARHNKQKRKGQNDWE